MKEATLKPSIGNTALAVYSTRVIRTWVHKVKKMCLVTICIVVHPFKSLMRYKVVSIVNALAVLANSVHLE